MVFTTPRDNDHNIFKIGTWNVRGVNGNVFELANKMKLSLHSPHLYKGLEVSNDQTWKFQMIFKFFLYIYKK